VTLKPAIGCNPDAIQEELCEYAQWVTWCLEEPDKPGDKPKKVLYDPKSGFRARTHDAVDKTYKNRPEDTWADFSTAVEAYRNKKNRDGLPYAGVGFVFTENDPFIGGDIDDCIDPETGEINPEAWADIQTANTYTEKSQSGTGVKIIGKGKKVGPECKRGDHEMYDSARFFALTGCHLAGTPTTIEERQEEFAELHRKWFPEKTRQPPKPSASVPGDDDDAALIERIRRSRQGGKFVSLFDHGDASAYGGDASRADLALCAILSSWTQRNAVRIDRLFRQSALMRPKWDEARGGQTYGEKTIAEAIENTTWTYEPPSEKRKNRGRSTRSEPEAEPPDPDALQKAKEFVAGLPDRLKDDSGAIFEPAALSALSLLRKHCPAEWARVRAMARKFKVSLRDLDAALKAFEAATETEEPEPDGEEERRVGDVLRDAPAATQNLCIPLGYDLSRGNVYRQALSEGEQSELVAYAPVLVSGRMRDAEENSESLRLTWKRPNGWREIIVERAVALDHRKLVVKADTGFPVASDNAAALVSYLHRFEADNFNSLPATDVSSHLGWQGEGAKRGFLWGRNFITPEGEILRPEDAHDHPDAILFHSNEPGDCQIADAFYASGTLEDWQKAVSGLDRYPRVQLALYAAFVPPLLAVLRAANIIVDMSNRTSTGKTTTLRVAASVWGNPNEREPNSVVGSWDSTRVWIERASAILNGLPLLLDDTKRAKRPEQIATTLYDVANGRGRGRGNVRGLQRTRQWQTVLLSTGEAPATGYTEDGGTRTRCIEVMGSPFGKETEETAKAVRFLNQNLLANFGHAGPKFVQWLLKHRADWPQYANWYRHDLADYTVQNGAVSRMAEHLAVIRLTAVLVKEAGILPWYYDEIPQELRNAILSEAQQASPEIRALREVISWAYVHKESFHGRAQRDNYNNSRVPNEWAGQWDDDEDWKTISFFPSVLKRVLEQSGFIAGAIIGGWKELGWLETDTDRVRTTKKVSIGGEKVWVNVILRHAADEIDG
jgi:hypothetical protein